jgi:hypothetical protein
METNYYKQPSSDLTQLSGWRGSTILSLSIYKAFSGHYLYQWNSAWWATINPTLIEIHQLPFIAIFILHSLHTAFKYFWDSINVWNQWAWGLECRMFLGGVDDAFSAEQTTAVWTMVSSHPHWCCYGQYGVRGWGWKIHGQWSALGKSVAIVLSGLGERVRVSLRAPFQQGAVWFGPDRGTESPRGVMGLTHIFTQSFSNGRNESMKCPVIHVKKSKEKNKEKEWVICVGDLPVHYMWRFTLVHWETSGWYSMRVARIDVIMQWIMFRNKQVLIFVISVI